MRAPGPVLILLGACASRGQFAGSDAAATVDVKGQGGSFGAFFDGELMCGGDWASVQVEVFPNSGYDVVAQCANGTADSMECDYDIDGGIVAVRANGASGGVRCPEPDPTNGTALAPTGSLAISGNVAAGACGCTETVTYGLSNPTTHDATAKFYDLPVAQ